MVFPLTVATVTLFYLSAIPVEFAFCLKLDDSLHLGTGFAIFEPRFAVRRALKSPGAKPHPSISLKKLDLPIFIRAVFRAARYLLTHLPPRGIMLNGSLGTPDAALTALICGSANAIGCTLRGLSSGGVRLDLRPDFSADHTRAELSGIISARAGHIMLAALLGVYEYGTGRFNTWKSIPSKAS